jgi:hypothetical protein
MSDISAGNKKQDDQDNQDEQDEDLDRVEQDATVSD